MCCPAIFRWPTPWLWCGLLGLVALKAEGFVDFLSGFAILVIVASATYYFGGRKHLEAPPTVTSDAGLEERLSAIERRLTDTQDVMIALSEKVDRWEDEFRSRKAGVPASPVARSSQEDEV